MVALALAIGTLRPAPGAVGPEAPWHCVLCGPTAGADAVANLLVFLPLGLTLGLAFRARGRRAGWGAAAGLALSVMIEVAQSVGIPGRVATVGDVLANSLGAALGALLAAHASACARPSRVTARWGLGVALSGWVGGSAVAAWLMQRAPAPGPWPPRLATVRAVPEMGWYAGRVEQVTVDGGVVRQRDAGPAVVDARVGHAVSVSLVLTGGDGRPAFVPYTFVRDGRGQGQVIVGQRGNDAVAEVRLRAAAWRLRAPRLVVPGAAEALRRGSVRARGVAEARYAAGVLRLAVTVAGRTWAGSVRLSPAQAWALVVPFGEVAGASGAALTAAWLAMWALPAGYWASWCATRAAGTQVRRAIGPALAVAGAAAAALALLPLGFGFAPARWWEWGATSVGVLVGGAIAAPLKRLA